MLYVLKKIDNGEVNIPQQASEAFQVNTGTIYRYLNELLDNEMIDRVKRGKYELISSTWNYTLSRSKGELDSEINAYKDCLLPHISDLNENIQSIWASVFSEMVNNIIDYSEAEHAIIQITRDVLNTKVRLYDDGVGIFERIKTDYSLKSALEARNELYKGKLTTDEDHHSGEGVFFSLRLMDVFYIVSSGLLLSNTPVLLETIREYTDRSYSGTILFMSLCNFTTRNTQEVFDQYSDENGKFFRTYLPISRIFDVPPVSRSQAKQITKRLEYFKEVELDFADIPWIGQGFAHEIFAVFQKKHPGVKLIPLNMGPDVAQMYKHVCP